MMGLGGVSGAISSPSVTSGTAIPASTRTASRRSASSFIPCVAAVRYANAWCPAFSRIFTRSGTSPRYNALWNWPMTSPRISDIFNIFCSFSMFPVMRYKNDSRSKFFVF
jgi:hypothetical protein